MTVAACRPRSSHAQEARPPHRSTLLAHRGSFCSSASAQAARRFEDRTLRPSRSHRGTYSAPSSSHPRPEQARAEAGGARATGSWPITSGSACVPD
eukprot:scaffold208851_cov33-Tisochrysis_lutea.AAC.1